MTTPRRLRHALAGLTVALTTSLLVSTGGGPATARIPADRSSTPANTIAKAPAGMPHNSCKRNRVGAPRCGVLWGMYLKPGPQQGSPQWKAPYPEMERKLHRRLDIIKAYMDFDTPVTWPNETQMEMGRHGHRMWEFSWNAVRDNNSSHLSYDAIARGDYDRAIIKPTAERLKAYGRRVVVDFDHENNIEGNATGVGTNADYVLAYRHIVKVFRRVGATNVKWAWIVAGWLSDEKDMRQTWPGAKFVDWIGYDPYNFAGCHRGSPWRTPYEAFHPFAAWTKHQKGMRNKPLMLGEYATQLGPNAGTWYRHVAKALQRIPRIKAVMEFGSNPGGCEFDVTGSAKALAGFRAAGLTDYVLGK